MEVMVQFHNTVFHYTYVLLRTVNMHIFVPLLLISI